MQKNFLITGSPCRLMVDIAHECLAQKQNVLLTLEPGMEPPNIPAGLEENLKYVEWSRRSPISARFVLLQAINQQMAIDNAIIVYAPKTDRIVFHEATAAFFEERIDTEIKGLIFMIKEVMAYFIRQRKGSLMFVLVDQTETALQPLDALAAQGLQGLMEALIAEYQPEPVVFRGFVGKDGQRRQIVDQVIQMILEDSARTRGKIHKLGGKLGFFNFGPK